MTAHRSLLLAGAFVFVPSFAMAHAEDQGVLGGHSSTAEVKPTDATTTTETTTTDATATDAPTTGVTGDASSTAPTPAAATATTPSATTPSTAAPTEQPKKRGILGNMGLGAVKVGLGTGDFTARNARENTDVGPSWDVRGVFGADSPVGVEAAYVGSSRGYNAPGLADSTQLMSNGAEGDIRIAAPIHAGDVVDIRPFAFGGLGWQYMTVWGDGPVDGARDPGDHILTIPAGVGLELGVAGVNIDLRGTYRHAVDSEIFGDATADFDDPDALHSYNVTAGLGFEF